MKVDYVPLLALQRDLYKIPRGMPRFEEYLRLMLTEDRQEAKISPLVIVNPMANRHLSDYLDHLIAADADRLAGEAISTLAATLDEEFGPFRASVVVADDLAGGWTNRWACEHGLRFGEFSRKRPWITAVLWSSEQPSAAEAERSIRAALLRAEASLRIGRAADLREQMAREGAILARAGFDQPLLDDEEAEYTREVIRPFLDDDDVRTTVECLFGDEAARSMGFTPQGLSPWAGLRLAVADALAPRP